MIVAEPVQEREAFRHVSAAHCGGCVFQRRNRVVQMRDHLLPVAHGKFHLREDTRSAPASSAARIFARHADRAACTMTLSRNAVPVRCARPSASRCSATEWDGTSEWMSVPCALSSADKRIEQKRHVVVCAPTKNGLVPRAPLSCLRRNGNTSTSVSPGLRRAVFSNASAREGRQRFRRIAGDVFRGARRDKAPQKSAQARSLRVGWKQAFALHARDRAQSRLRWRRRKRRDSLDCGASSALMSFRCGRKIGGNYPACAMESTNRTRKDASHVARELAAAFTFRYRFVFD